MRLAAQRLDGDLAYEGGVRGPVNPSCRGGGDRVAQCWRCAAIDDSPGSWPSAQALHARHPPRGDGRAGWQAGAVPHYQGDGRRRSRASGGWTSRKSSRDSGSGRERLVADPAALETSVRQCPEAEAPARTGHRPRTRSRDRGLLGRRGLPDGRVRAGRAAVGAARRRRPGAARASRNRCLPWAR